MSRQVEHEQGHNDRTRVHGSRSASHPLGRINRHEIRRLIIALPMLAAGGSALLFSYVYSSLILTFIGLGLVFWGSVLYYITSTRYYPEELFRAVIEAYGKGLADVLRRFGPGERSISVLFYPRQLRLGGLTQGYILVHAETAGRVQEGNAINLSHYLEEFDGYGRDDGKGGSGDASVPLPQAHDHMILRAPAQGLIDLFENRLNSNFALMGMDDLSMNLERLFVEEFMIADSIDVSMEGDDTVRVSIKGRDTAAICSSMHAVSTALCPVCSSIALALAKSTGKAVLIRESRVGRKGISTVYSLLEVV